MIEPVPDSVFIHNLTVEAIIGVLDHERSTPQPVRIDLDMQVDTSRAAQSRNLRDTIDYAAMAAAVRQLVIEAEALLVETLAQDIARQVLSDDLVGGVTVRVTKPKALPGETEVGVQIHRYR